MSTNKSFSTETSERYSRALFEVAQEASELEKIENDIKNFASLLNNSVEIKNFIHNPTQSKQNQNNVLELLAEKLKLSKNLKNFMFLLIEKRNYNTAFTLPSTFFVCRGINLHIRRSIRGILYS